MDNLAVPTNSRAVFQKVQPTMPTHRSEILAFLKTHGLSDLKKNDGKAQYQNSPNIESQQSTSAESHIRTTSFAFNQPATQDFQKLLKDEEYEFLKTYGREIYEDMCNSEFKCQFPSLLTKQQYVTRQLRASLVDWLFEVSQKMLIEDRTVIYQAINLMDRYYEVIQFSAPQKDLQLTAVTSLFIASKNLEVEPLDLKTCCKDLCYNKYSKKMFLQKEADIRLATNYEVEASTGLDFIMLYTRLIKMEFQKVADCLLSTQQFMFDI